MDFSESAEASAFRHEVREWLNRTLVGDYRRLGTSAEMGAHDWHVRVAWEQELGRAGWLGLTWPKAFEEEKPPSPKSWFSPRSTPWLTVLKEPGSSAKVY